MAVITTRDQPRSTEMVGGVRAVRRRRRSVAGDLLPRRGRRAPPPHLREEVSRRFAAPGAPSHSLGAAPRRRLRSNNVERRWLTGLVGRRAGLHRNVQFPRRGWQSGRVWGQPGFVGFEERSICVRPVACSTLVHMETSTHGLAESRVCFMSAASSMHTPKIGPQDT